MAGQPPKTRPPGFGAPPAFALLFFFGFWGGGIRLRLVGFSGKSRLRKTSHCEVGSRSSAAETVACFHMSETPPGPPAPEHATHGALGALGLCCISRIEPRGLKRVHGNPPAPSPSRYPHPGAAKTKASCRSHVCPQVVAPQTAHWADRTIFGLENHLRWLSEGGCPDRRNPAPPKNP